MTLAVLLPDAKATQSLGAAIAQWLPAGTVMLLDGDLGAGKTTLVQGLAAELGIREPVASPTFVLVNEYLEGRIPLYHFDLYRLDPDQVEPLALDRYWDGGEFDPGIVAIEWSERLPEAPAGYLRVCLRDDRAGRCALVTIAGEMPPMDLGQLQNRLAQLDLEVWVAVDDA